MFISAGNIIKLHNWPLIHNLDLEPQFTPNHSSRIKQISLCNDNSYLGILQENAKAQIISIKDKSDIHLVHTIYSVKDVSSICFKRYTKRNIALGTINGEVLIYDTKLRAEIKTYPKLSNTIQNLDFTCDDQQLGVTCANSVVIFNTSSEEEDLDNEYKQSSTCTAFRFHPSMPSMFAIGCEDGSVALWDLNTYSKVLYMQQHLCKITDLAITKSSNMLITAGKDHKLCIINTTSGETEYKISLHMPITSIDVSEDDKTVVCGLEDGSMYLCDLKNLVLPVFRMKAHTGPVSAIRFENGNTRDAPTECMDTVSNVSSLPVTEYRDNKSECLASQTDYPARVATPNKHRDKIVKNELLEKVKYEIFKTVKAEIEDLESQLDEHCTKFQAFLTNEFEIISDVVREKWDIFSLDDLGKSVQDSTTSQSQPESAL